MAQNGFRRLSSGKHQDHLAPYSLGELWRETSSNDCRDTTQTSMARFSIRSLKKRA